MASSLDMSLDDLIKNSKTAAAGAATGNGNGRARGKGRSGGHKNNGGSSGPIRKDAARSAAPRHTPYSKPATRAPDGQWDHDMFEDGTGASRKPNTGIETGTKLFISNLHFGVSNEDIKELFSEIGDLKRCSVHYDRSGRSKGTAEVVFSRRADAENATKRFNNVQLDGNPMKIEIIGTNLQTAVTSNKILSAPSFGNGRGQRDTSSRGRGGSSKRGRGRGRGRGSEKVEKSAADLDAELEDYHAEAMQVS